MKRVLHIVDRISGGVPVAVRAYIENSPDNLEHHVLVPFQDGSLPEVWTNARAIFHDMGNHPLHRWRAVRDTVRNHAIDVVHAHSSFSGVYMRTALSSRRLRLVYTPHCYAFERQDISPFERLLFRIAEGALAWNTTIVAACSPGEAVAADAMRGIRSASILVPNVASVAPTTASRSHTGLRRVGMIGRISEQKGVDHFIDAVDAIRATMPETRATWIGNGDEAMAQRLAEHDVDVTGWVLADAVASALDDLDLYIHSAAWEGFPISLLDAHLRKVPIVVRAITAFPNVPKEFTTESLADNLRNFTDSQDGYISWVRRNHDFWSEYLKGNTLGFQQRSLARAWLDQSEEPTRSTTLPEN
jgi:glycosyltransferase involved in cell wall biosynthesis